MQNEIADHKIMAINPGWRCLGIAIFDNFRLREWRLRGLRVRETREKTEKTIDILADYIHRYNPKILAIKRLHLSRSSLNLRKLTSAIRASCRRRGLMVHSYSIDELEGAFSTGRINKKELVRLVAREYPELESELKREERNRNPYFIRLFEAVALGHVCHQKVNNKH